MNRENKITNISHDSRLVQPGDTFVCLPGGEPYIKEALSRGAKDVLHCSREEMAILANRVYAFPSKKLTVIGITGTNGKTTVAYLVGQALLLAGYDTYILGTLNASLTTPESIETQELMAKHVQKGGTHFVMEVSSHGIHQKRTDGIDFAVKLLTNITPEHLDYHETLEAYAAVKHQFMEAGEGKKIGPEVFALETIDMPCKLQGSFNHQNIKATIAILKACGFTKELLREVIPMLDPPPGRFELIEESQNFKVIVDYAHTPDGLKNILIEAKKMADMQNGRVLTLFGCGGDRDKNKRPKMGNIATGYSDVTVITADNPRHENQSAITADILGGVDPKKEVKVIENRKEAIAYIIHQASQYDVVVLAGKGHEPYQIIGDKKIMLDDSVEARNVLRGLDES
jgi:UDP-N-acetylmuramoyl-L-alanyl-D-glutamate--2,6-diaminopimelate ligase